MIRQLRITDIPNLMEFFFADRRIHQDERFNFTSDDFKQMTTHSHIYQLIWEENNEIIGYLAGYNMGVWGYIDVLIVKSSHRNRSIGSSLIKQFESLHPEWLRVETSCYAQDSESINFVKKQGFNIQQTLEWFGKEV